MSATFTLDILQGLPEPGRYEPGDRIEVRFIVTVEDTYRQGADTMLVPGEPEYVRARLLPKRPAGANR